MDDYKELIENPELCWGYIDELRTAIEQLVKEREKHIVYEKELLTTIAKADGKDDIIHCLKEGLKCRNYIMYYLGKKYGDCQSCSDMTCNQRDCEPFCFCNNWKPVDDIRISVSRGKANEID